MTGIGEGVEGLGPTFCPECKASPGTSIHGENHPICTTHRHWLLDWFQEHPERRLGWEGDWNERRYGWVAEVRETQDNNSTPGDHDKPYTFFTPSQLHARGAISIQSALKMYKLKETYFGKGLREEPV